MKLFTPDQVIECEDKFDLQKRLFSMICYQCCCEQGITQISNIEDMLCTPCGAQFDVED